MKKLHAVKYGCSVGEVVVVEDDSGGDSIGGSNTSGGFRKFSNGSSGRYSTNSHISEAVPHKYRATNTHGYGIVCKILFFRSLRGVGMNHLTGECSVCVCMLVLL